MGDGGSDKHLDVGDLSDVSDVSFHILYTHFKSVQKKFSFCEFFVRFFVRMKKIWRLPMPREFGVRTLNRVFRRRYVFIHHVDDGKLSYRKRERCMVSIVDIIVFF